MKNLFFALLACLLTACFRAPHLSTLPIHSPIVPGSEVAAPLPPDPEVYASASQVAAAGTFTPEAGEVDAIPAATPVHAPAPADAGRVATTEARLARRPANLRRELRKAMWAVLLHKRPAAGAQDNPAPREGDLPAISLIAGIVGVVSPVVGFAGAVIGLGPGVAVLFPLGFLGGLTAVITGGIAKGRIRRGEDAESGRGKATAGLILGIVNLSVLFLLIILILLIAIAFPGGFFSGGFG